MPTPQRFGYARCSACAKSFPTGYEDASLDAFAARAIAWRKAGREGYLF